MILATKHLQRSRTGNRAGRGRGIAARRTVAIVIQVQRGPLVRIDRIQVRGNAKTRDLVIRREIVIVEGDLYNQTLVETSKAEAAAFRDGLTLEYDESDAGRPSFGRRTSLQPTIMLCGRGAPGTGVGLRR